MQPLPATTNQASSSACATALLDGAPGLFWYIRRHMRRHRQGVSIPQFRVLVKVQTDGEVSLSCVAEHLGASLPTTSRIVATLVNKGFLKRAHSTEDRRQLTISLTPKGRAIAVAAREASLRRMEEELSAMAAGDRAAICGAFEILSGFIGSARQAAAGAAPLEAGAARRDAKKLPEAVA
jgi:DNA-binding MarR family transcriptional regulator